MTTIFLTASGTGIGKTFVARLLIRQLRSAGHSVRALKPVATGFDAGDLAASDTAQLLAAQGLAPTPENLDRLTPWRFRAPLSPDMAAAREARVIPFARLLEFCREVGGDVTLIEGIGGVMVPLDDRHTVLDWIEALEAPVLLIVGSYLGTLSHTLTAAGMLLAREQKIAGIVVNQSAEEPVGLDETAAAIRRLLPAVRVQPLPRARGAEPPSPDLLPLLAPYL